MPSHLYLKVNLKLFRIFRSPLCAAVLACAFGFSSVPIHAALVPGSKDLGSIWCIGDSITQSNADGDNNSSPRKSLYDKLMAAGYTFTYTGSMTTPSVDGMPATGSDPASNLYQYHTGVSGAVIGTNMLVWGNPVSGITQNLPLWWTSGRLAVVKPNVILLLIGANDVDSGFDLANAPTRLTTLIDTIYALPGVGNPTILMATITPNENSAGVNVPAFNAGIPGVVQHFQSLGKDIYIVDQFSVLNAHLAVVMANNLHPNTLGNDYMAQNWFNSIQSYVGAAIPVAPYGLSAAATNTNQVTLAWNVVPGAANGYNVKRSLVSGSSYVTLTNLTATSYTDSNALSATKYYYVVTATNSVGESTNNSEVAATTPAVLLAPPAPTVAATVSGMQAVLNWPAVSGATGYKIKRSTVSGGSYVVLATNLTTTYTNTIPSKGTPYYFVVSAFNAQGDSTNSAQVRILIPLALDVSHYIGGAFAQGLAVTAGASAGDSVGNIVYDMPKAGICYTNLSGTAQTMQLVQVNFFTGSKGSGTITPFVSLYTGTQVNATTQVGANYSVLSIGDAITVVAANALQNSQFLVGGVNPMITLNPGAVLTAGFLASTDHQISYDYNSGLDNYVHSGNSLPLTLPNPFTANSTYAAQNHTMKINIGFGVQAAVATNAVSLVYQVSGSQIQYSWPTDHIGWRLQAQTNVLDAGIGTNWSDVPNATLTNQITIPIGLTNGSVFFRLVYP